jgi:hypothetical protein
MLKEFQRMINYEPIIDVCVFQELFETCSYRRETS